VNQDGARTDPFDLGVQHGAMVTSRAARPAAVPAPWT
jgi:hypothetical protein